MIDCVIRGCRNLQTTCIDCGKIVCTKILPEVNQCTNVTDTHPEGSCNDQTTLQLLDNLEKVLLRVDDSNVMILEILDRIVKNQNRSTNT